MNDEKQKNNNSTLLKRLVGVIIICILVGFGYWTLSPLFLEKNINEKIQDLGISEEEMEIIAQGNFVGLAGHNGSGSVTLFEVNDKKYIHFEDDFFVTNGPDLFVYFGKDDKYNPDTQLGELKGNRGSQFYEIPQSFDISSESVNEVWVWCRAFHVPFSKAQMKRIE